MTRREYLLSLPDEEFIPFEQDDKYGFRNAAGEVLIAPEFDWLHPDYKWSGEYTEVSVNQKWGYINKAGEVVLAIEYDDIYPIGFDYEPEMRIYYSVELMARVDSWMSNFSL